MRKQGLREILSHLTAKLLGWELNQGHVTPNLFCQLPSFDSNEVKKAFLEFPPGANHRAVLLFSPLHVQYASVYPEVFYLLTYYPVSRIKRGKSWNSILEWCLTSGVEPFPDPKGLTTISQWCCSSPTLSLPLRPQLISFVISLSYSLHPHFEYVFIWGEWSATASTQCYQRFSHFVFQTWYIVFEKMRNWCRRHLNDLPYVQQWYLAEPGPGKALWCQNPSETQPSWSRLRGPHCLLGLLCLHGEDTVHHVSLGAHVLRRHGAMETGQALGPERLGIWPLVQLLIGTFLASISSSAERRWP